ncbi:MAG: hypothetical protein JNM80_01545 [Phycisphaerae bacterium]|nr:hypothetical protein [Phycisphaerae bacterium]
MRSIPVTLSALLVVSPAALGQAYSESFEGGTNAAGWTFGAAGEGPTTPGGVNGSWRFQSTPFTTTAPVLRCAANAPGPTGNFRARRVGYIVVALRVDASDLPVANLAPAVILVSFNGTPADPSDDWGAYNGNLQGLGPTGVWRHHTVTLDPVAASPSFGWNFIALGPSAPANPTWSALVTQVDRLDFSLADPTITHPSQTWSVSADAIWLSPGLCYPNCDGSTISPYLNVNDFVCFNNLFAVGDPRANCDRSTTPPTMNVNDFICFNENFAAGCSAP